MKFDVQRALLLIFIGIVLTCATLKAQNLHIFYNVFTDSVRYELNGKDVTRPRLRKGGTVFVHLLEYNPYLYSATVTLHNDPGKFLVAGTQSFSDDELAGNAIDGASPVMGIFGTLSSPMFNMPLMNMGGEELSLASFAGSARGGAEEQMLRETDEMLQETAETEAKIQEIGARMRQSGRALTIAMLIEEQLKQIVYNPKIPPSEIKRLCKEYFSAMFGPERLDSLSLLSSLDWAENSQVFRKQAGEWKRQYQKWDKQITELEGQMLQLKSMSWTDPALNSRLQAIDAAVETSVQERDGFESIMAASEKLLEDIGTIPAGTLANLYLRYTELMGNDCTYEDFFYLSGEDVALRVEIAERDTAAIDFSADKPANIVKARTFVVESYGGLRVSAGAGVNFAQFFEQPLTYGVRDDAIVADPDDRFLPAISSQLMFYADRGARMSFGGSFGIGLPVLTGEQAQAAMFFLGPSVIFGSGQRLVLTTGVLGGKVNQLAKGFEVGDPFDPSQGDIPLTSRYEYGYFLGLSFNLSGK